MNDDPKFESQEEANAVLLKMVTVTLTVAQSTQRLVDRLLLAVAILAATNIVIVFIVLLLRGP